jgi:hypothetical protein
MKIKTTNTILYCKKWQETVIFYKNLLILPVTFSNDWFVEFKLNETSCLSIANEDKALINSSGGEGITITMEVDDIINIHLFLIEASTNPTPIKNHSWGAKVFNLYDPEGNRLEFWQKVI